MFAIILLIALIKILSQPKWDARFWLTVLAVWFIGASALTYEHRKATWLFLSLAVASAAITKQREEDLPLVEGDLSAGSFPPQPQVNEILQRSY
jgi:hypothetical protein